MSKQNAKTIPAAEPDIAPDDNHQPTRRPFRAADVLTGTIDKRRHAAPRPRKQISAQLDANQVRMLGELHARLNATAEQRIEKSDLVGLGIELLAAVLQDVDGERDPAPDGASRGRGKRKSAGETPPSGGRWPGGPEGDLRDVDDIRLYLRTHVRAYAESRR